MHRVKILERQNIRMPNLALNTTNVNPIDIILENAIERLNISIVDKIISLKVIDALYVSKNSYIII